MALCQAWFPHFSGDVLIVRMFKIIILPSKSVDSSNEIFFCTWGSTFNFFKTKFLHIMIGSGWVQNSCRPRKQGHDNMSGKTLFYSFTREMLSCSSKSLLPNCKGKNSRSIFREMDHRSQNEVCEFFLEWSIKIQWFRGIIPVSSFKNVWEW